MKQSLHVCIEKHQMFNVNLVMCDLTNISYSCTLVVIKYIGHRLVIIIPILTGVKDIVI